MQAIHQNVADCCNDGYNSIECTNDYLLIFHPVLFKQNQEIIFSILDVLYMICVILAFSNMINIASKRNQLAISKMFTMNLIIFIFTISNCYS